MARTPVTRLPLVITDMKLLSGLDLWLKADAISGVTIDGTAVSSWTDMSGNNRHAVQATGSKQPLYKASILNSMPAVRFDGVDDFLTSTFSVNASSGTVFIVIKNFVTNGTYSSTLYRSDAGTRTYLTASAIGSQTVNYTKGQASNVLIGGSLTTTSSSHLYRNVWRTTNTVQRCDCFVSGVQKGYDVNLAAAGLGTNGTYVSLGSLSNTGAQWAQVDICEIIQFNRTMTDSETFIVENYLNGKYGFSAQIDRAPVTRIPVTRYSLDYEPETLAAIYRIAAAPGGYYMNSAQAEGFNTRMVGLKSALGRAPALWHDGELSVNKNQLTFSEDFSNAVWQKLGTTPPTVTNNYGVAPDGTTTSIRIQMNATAGSEANRIERAGSTLLPAVAAGMNSITHIWIKGTGLFDLRFGAGGDYTTSSNITASATWTQYSLPRTSVGATNVWNILGKNLVGGIDMQVWHPQLELGSTVSSYNPRLDATAVKSLNLGTAGATGDGTFTGTNASSASMIDFVGTRRVYKSVAASSQTVLTSYNNASGANPDFLFGFLNVTALSNMALIGRQGSATDRRLLRYTSTPLTVYSVDAGTTNSGTGTTAAGVWNSIGGKYDGANVTVYIAGINRVTGAIAAASTAAGISFMGSSNASLYLDGTANHLMYDPNLYSNAQVLAVHNLLSADVGL